MPINTPCFPAFRARLAALGRRTASRLRQATLQQLAAHLAELIPVPRFPVRTKAPTAGSGSSPCA